MTDHKMEYFGELSRQLNLLEKLQFGEWIMNLGVNDLYVQIRTSKEKYFLKYAYFIFLEFLEFYVEMCYCM